LGSLFFRWQSANPLPGVKRLLRHLHKNGVPLALASNSIRRNIDHKILKLGGLNFSSIYMDHVLCSEKNIVTTWDNWPPLLLLSQISMECNYVFLLSKVNKKPANIILCLRFVQRN
jgi:hypothetical protein